MTKRGLVLLVALGVSLGACGGGGSGSASSFCGRMKNDSTAFANASEASAITELKKVESASPSAIKGDMKTLVDFLDSSSSTHPQVPSASEISKLTKAETNIESYAKDKCGIDLKGGS